VYWFDFMRAGDVSRSALRALTVGHRLRFLLHRPSVFGEIAPSHAAQPLHGDLFTVGKKILDNELGSTWAAAGLVDTHLR
jgi:hypothetical protein